MAHQVTMCPELRIMNRKLHDQPSHWLGVHNSNLLSTEHSIEKTRLGEAWKLQVICMYRWLRILQQLIPTAMPLLCLIYTYGLTGVHYDQLTDEEKIWAGCFYTIWWYPPESIIAPLRGEWPWRTVVKPLGGQYFEQYIWFTTFVVRYD